MCSETVNTIKIISKVKKEITTRKWIYKNIIPLIAPAIYICGDAVLLFLQLHVRFYVVISTAHIPFSTASMSATNVLESKRMFINKHLVRANNKINIHPFLLTPPATHVPLQQSMKHPNRLSTQDYQQLADPDASSAAACPGTADLN